MSKDLVPLGGMQYEVVKRDLLHLQGGYELTIVLIFRIRDPEGGEHHVRMHLSEKDFGQFVADVGLDVYRIKQAAAADEKSGP